jgi:FkbM family methyltransferase
MINIYRVLSFIERVVQYCQGKGYGSSSIDSEVRTVKKLLNSGLDIKLAIDIGGNIGQYTDALIKAFPETEVHIFEPQKINIEKLRLKFIEQNNIKIQQLGVSNKNDTMTLYSNKNGSGLASLSKRKLDHFGIDFNLEEKVDVIKFEDYWINNLNKREIDLLKMDIEGFELYALEGLGSAIKHIKAIQIEFGGANIDSRTFFQDFWYFFKQHNYELFRITPFGIQKIAMYKERDEFFSTTNFIAIRKV